MRQIDYFIAAMLLCVLIGISFGVWLKSAAAGLGFAFWAMLIGAMFDYIVSKNDRL
jgi:hypothetical protein